MNIGSGSLIPRSETEMIDLAETFMQVTLICRRLHGLIWEQDQEPLSSALLDCDRRTRVKQTSLAMDASPTYIDCSRNHLKRLNIDSVKELLGG